MKKIFGLMVLAALFSLNVLADIAPPPKPQQVDAEIGISIDRDTKEATLVISRELIDELAKANGTEGTKVGANLSLGRTQTLVSGLFLSLALVFGGVWFARSKNLGTNSRIALGAAVFAILGVGASVALGNAAPPLYTNINSKLFSKGLQTKKSAFGKIKVEISDDTRKDFIRLIVPEETKAKTTNDEEE